MFEMLWDSVGSKDKQLKTLAVVHDFVCLYKAGYKLEYEYVKSRLDEALKIIRTAHANGEIKSWSKNKRLLGQQILLLEKEIKGNDYELSKRVLQLHNQVEKSILGQ